MGTSALQKVRSGLATLQENTSKIVPEIPGRGRTALVSRCYFLSDIKESRYLGAAILLRSSGVRGHRFIFGPGVQRVCFRSPKNIPPLSIHELQKHLVHAQRHLRQNCCQNLWASSNSTSETWRKKPPCRTIYKHCIQLKPGPNIEKNNQTGLHLC